MKIIILIIYKSILNFIYTVPFGIGNGIGINMGFIEGIGTGIGIEIGEGDTLGSAGSAGISDGIDDMAGIDGIIDCILGMAGSAGIIGQFVDRTHVGFASLYRV